jgi:hypothetical protein
MYRAIFLTGLILSVLGFVYALMKAGAKPTPKIEPPAKQNQMQMGQTAAYSPLPVDFTDYDEPVDVPRKVAFNPDGTMRQVEQNWNGNVGPCHDDPMYQPTAKASM